MTVINIIGDLLPFDKGRWDDGNSKRLRKEERCGGRAAQTTRPPDYKPRSGCSAICRVAASALHDKEKGGEFESLAKTSIPLQPPQKALEAVLAALSLGGSSPRCAGMDLVKVRSEPSSPRSRGFVRSPPVEEIPPGRGDLLRPRGPASLSPFSGLSSHGSQGFEPLAALSGRVLGSASLSQGSPLHRQRPCPSVPVRARPCLCPCPSSSPSPGRA
jgi:hypothetical protein